MLKLTYLSHAVFMLDDGKHQVLIDPYLTPNPLAAAKPEDLHPQFIVMTHAHGDHFSDCIPIAKANDSLVIAINELGNYLTSEGVKAHNIQIGGAYNFPFGRVKFTIAHHSSSLDDGRYMGDPAGVVITMGGKTIYHCGDTGLFLDMKLIGELDKIDVMLAPIGDNFTMGIDDAVKAVEFVNPELVIPMHYNTFPVIKADPDEFKTKVEGIGKKARVMEYGETIEF